jgi:subtilisin family serine protease
VHAIVRDTNGLLGLNLGCLLLGCNVLGTLDGSVGQVFLVSSNTLSLQSLLAGLLGLVGVVDAEPEQTLHAMQSSSTTSAPWLQDESPVSYYGTTVWRGYVSQPAVQLINLTNAQQTYKASGAGTVAVIDTGVDPTHPVLQNVLLSGYDFTRNQSGGSELSDLNQSTVAMLDQTSPFELNQSTVAMLDQSTVAMLDGGNYGDFGHGTMTAGIVHLVAPTARIMPLKAFRADGTAQLSDVLRAIYYASQHGANVISMSFDLQQYSPELANAASYASRKGLILVASAGNDGQQIQVWPSALTSTVIGVASVDNQAELSSFSNYGSQDVFMAAPGEAIMTTYPFGTYAAGWGTSFSAPQVAGAAALLLSARGGCNQSCAFSSLAHAEYLGAYLNHGLLQTDQAVQAWQAQ